MTGAALEERPPPASAEALPAAPAGRRVARNTVIVAAATAASRVSGLGREVLASAYFGTSGAFSAFTLAFQLPNLVRSLVSDASFSSAFVPVFTELWESGRRNDALRLAATLLLVFATGLTLLSAAFVVTAGLIVPAVTGDGFSGGLDGLTILLSRILFPTVVLLGVQTVLVGVLNARDSFTAAALAPVAWNALIIAGLVVAHTRLDGEAEVTGYAVAVVAGTLAQLLVLLPAARRHGVRLAAPNLRSPELRRVLRLMAPITLASGVFYVDVLMNSVVGSLISAEAPRAIDAALRINVLAHGVISIAVATVVFPALSRHAARGELADLRDLLGGAMRWLLVLLMPVTALGAVLAVPITRLVYERGAFGAESTALVSVAVLWFSLSTPAVGLNFLLTRVCFSLQRPWATLWLAGGNLALNAAVSLALYEPLGIAGPVIGTLVGSVGMTAGLLLYLRPRLGGLPGGGTLATLAGTVVGCLPAAAAGLFAWQALDAVLGRALWAQTLALGAALALGCLVYWAAIAALRVPQARQAAVAVRARLGRGGSDGS